MVTVSDPEIMEEVLREAKAEMELEEFRITEEDEQDFKDVLSGKMSRKVLIGKLKRGG